MICARRSSLPIVCSQQRLQGFDRRPVGTAVDAVRAKVALKCRHHRLRELVINAGCRDPIAIVAQCGLQIGNRGAAIAGTKPGAGRNRRGRDPGADTRAVQPCPREFFSRIKLALRRHVGMRQHTAGTNAVPRHDISAQRNDGGDLRLWKIRIAKAVTGIGDFNSDAARIDVALAFPRRFTSVPGTARLRHELENLSVLVHHVMRRHFRARIAQASDRGGGARHAGVVEQQDVGRKHPLVVVGRRYDLAD